MNHDKDAALDRVLGPTLKGRIEAPPDPTCLDADTLAAWADDGLERAERKAVEAHAAGCARCQALLAAMVKTLPPPEAAVSPVRTRAFWWLAAMTPVAAALVIWIAVPAAPPVQRSQSAEAVDQIAPAPAASAAPRSPAGAARVEADAPAPGAAPESPAAAAQEQKAATAPSANMMASAETLAQAQDAAALAAAAPTAAATAPVAAGAAAEAAPRRDARSAQARASAFASAIDTVVVSSNPATRFRLLPGGGVERSADGGATWRNEATGAAATLIAGSSPSPSVCWLIGQAGTVVRSNDGRSWVRVPFPEAVDLQAITASDTDTATVTTADGRTFATTDGGRTWSRPPDF